MDSTSRGVPDALAIGEAGRAVLATLFDLRISYQPRKLGESLAGAVEIISTVSSHAENLLVEVAHWGAAAVLLSSPPPINTVSFGRAFNVARAAHGTSADLAKIRETLSFAVDTLRPLFGHADVARAAEDVAEKLMTRRQLREDHIKVVIGSGWDESQNLARTCLRKLADHLPK